MSDRRRTTLGDIARVVGGGTPKTSDPSYWGGDILWLTPGELTQQEGQVVTTTERRISAAGLAASSAKLLPVDAVLLTSRATVGAVAMAGQPMATNQGFQSLIAGEDVLPAFLMYWVQGNRAEFQSRASGSTFPEISGKKVKTIPIELPSIEEQRRVVHVMSSIDRHVFALRREAEALQELYTASSQLLWANGEVRELGAVLSVEIERLLLEPDQQYKLAGVLNAGQGVVDKGSLLGRDTEYKAMNVLRAGRLVMRKLTAWEGPVAVIQPEHEGFVASNEFPTFKLHDDLDARWLAHACRSDVLWTEMRSRVTGSVQRRKRLNPEQLLAVQLPIPGLDDQRRVADALDAVLQQVHSVTREAEALSGVRAALLAGLLDGTEVIASSFTERRLPAQDRRTA